MAAPGGRDPGALAAVLGGLLWVLHAVLLVSRPEGCVAQGCALSAVPPRPSEDLAWLLLLAVVLLALAAGRPARAEGRAGRGLLLAGSGLMWTGAVLLVVGLGVNAVAAGDSPLWWLHDSDSLGRLLPVAGSMLTGIGMLRMRGPATWAGVALVVAALVAVPFNAQDERVLLDVPLGLAWLSWGWSSATRAGASGPEPVDPGAGRGYRGI